MLLSHYQSELLPEAGCDEAGRGCLAGPVFAAAVIFAPDYENAALNDSKQLTARRRYHLREEIKRDALAWAVASASPEEIDTINILNASILAMHRALEALSLQPSYVIVDGNRFKPYGTVPHTTIVKGDGRYLTIAAASILAKTSRDDYMARLHNEFPWYGWDHNAGYPTREHCRGIALHGLTPWHRRSFRLPEAAQPSLFDTLTANTDAHPAR